MTVPCFQFTYYLEVQSTEKAELKDRGLINPLSMGVQRVYMQQVHFNIYYNVLPHLYPAPGCKGGGQIQPGPVQGCSHCTQNC